MTRGQTLYQEAKQIIPGGTQLLSKRPELHLPDFWPAYYQKANGCEVTDLDGRKYTDMSLMGIGTCILGYADKDVDRAVKKAIDQATMTTLNCPEEVELAKVLCKIHRWADMVRFARTGGESMGLAIRIARAKTGRDKILFCGYHGWHDWYLSANITDEKSLDRHLLSGLEPAGVPRALGETAIPFHYNDTDEFLALMKKYEGRVAAVVMEPVRNIFPDKGFLETIRTATEKAGIVFIFDEITSGWRLNLGGAHLKLKVHPDIAVFAKGMSNGYPMAAVIGRRDVMEAVQKTFISSTYWTERIGPTAALAAIEKMRTCRVAAYLNKIGRQVQAGWKRSASRHGLDVEVGGIYPLGHFSFPSSEAMVLKTLFTQCMLEKGFLATTSFYASYAHQPRHIAQYLKAVDETFRFLAEVIKEGNPRRYLKGSVCHSGFQRLN